MLIPSLHPITSLLNEEADEPGIGTKRDDNPDTRQKRSEEESR
jgi:hypothetical protein